MKCEESKKALLYIVTGEGCTPASIEEILFNFMADNDIIQAYVIRISTVD